MKQELATVVYHSEEDDDDTELATFTGEFEDENEVENEDEGEGESTEERNNSNGESVPDESEISHLKGRSILTLLFFHYSDSIHNMIYDRLNKTCILCMYLADQPRGSKDYSGENSKSAVPSRVKSRKRKAVQKDSQFKCPHCRRRCLNKDALELHMTHHKQQFQCPQCLIWLADKSVLNRHMRVHTGSRPFSCEFCNQCFSRQDIAKKHMQRKHKDMLDK